MVNGIRRRRELREMKQRKKTAGRLIEEEVDLAPEEPLKTCWICGSQLVGDDETINCHIDGCLLRYEIGHGDDQDEQDDGNVVDDLSSHQRADLDQDADLDVEIDIEDDDTDERSKFGKAQFTSDSLEKPSGTSNTSLITNATSSSSSSSILPSPVTSNSKMAIFGSTNEILIDALKARLKECESSAASSPKCLICMSAYINPVVSIVCWHVHCEECWMLTLKEKRLCPQCQVITSPEDLRRIYL